MITENVYDDSGNIVATRKNTDPWECKTYDSRGRITQDAIPALANTTHVTRSARTITYTYVTNHVNSALESTISDGSGKLTTDVDLLGRMIQYIDEQKFVSGSSTTINDYGTQYTYDNLGRLATKNGIVNESYTYDNYNRLTAQKIGTTTVASPSYDAYSRMSGVAYNAAGVLSLSISRDALGRQNGVTYTRGTSSPGTTISDAVTLSQSGKVVSGTENGNAKTYTYDKADRLTAATFGSSTYGYSFATPTACTGTYNANAGKDSDRTSQTVNGTTTTYCYNNADQLIKSSGSGYTTDTYDAHGNFSTGSSSASGIEYDSSDRAAYIGSSSTKLSYDPINRQIVESVWSGDQVYADGTDNAVATYNQSYTLDDAYVQLPGGVLLTLTSSGISNPSNSSNTYSLPDTVGNIFDTASGTGSAGAWTFTYDPFGNITSSPTPSNSNGTDYYGFKGANERFTLGSTNYGYSVMGSRLYNPHLGTFAQTDPVAGGNENPYNYPADPINNSDTNGDYAMQYFTDVYSPSNRKQANECMNNFACSMIVLAPVPGGDEVDGGVGLAKAVQAFKAYGHNMFRIGTYRGVYRLSIGPAAKYYEASKYKWLYPLHIHWDLKPFRAPFIERNWWK